jgi:hypothetical protein
MNLLDSALGVLGSVLLPVAAGLLFEELTLGGLVRLLLAPRPSAGKPREQTNRNGGSKCSR